MSCRIRLLIVLIAPWAMTAAELIAAPNSHEKPDSRQPEVRIENLTKHFEAAQTWITKLFGRRLLQFHGPDQHSLLRDELGRPIGIWGVDSLNTELERAR
jgi:hypothetical protein